MSARELEGILAVADFSMPAVEARTGEDARVSGVVIGQIVGFRDEGVTPLVVHPRQSGTAAWPARAIVDLCGDQIGQDVVLMFEGGDPQRPIVLGCVRNEKTWRLQQPPGNVEVDADGERLVINAKEQVVLRCGKASITLTKAGKVMIQGSYVVSRSSGVNRIKGGSIQLN